MSRRSQLLVLGVLLAVLVAVSVRSVRRVQRQNASWEVCSAVLEGRLQEAAESSISGFDAPALRAAECRCRAQIALGETDRCVSDLEARLQDERRESWLPSPELTAIVVGARRSAGHAAEAETLAAQGRVAYPSSKPLRLLTFDLLAERLGEGEALALSEREWKEAGSPASEWSAFLAARRLARREWVAATDLLGDDQPPGVARDEWFTIKGLSLAGAGRSDELSTLFDRWYAADGDPAIILAQYATMLSVFGLADRGTDVIDLLQRAAAQDERIADRELLRLLYTRLIGHLSVEGRREEAHLWLERAKSRGFEPSEMLPEDLEAATSSSADGGRVGAPARVVFRLPDARRTALELSSDTLEQVDAPFRSLAVGGRSRIEIERAPGVHPLRWVLRNGDQLCERGTVMLRGGADAEVDVSATPCRPAARYRPPTKRAADGKRRVALVVLDCADWRLVRYLEARGEVPFLTWAIAHGTSAVLTSRPPFTSVAIDKLIHPQIRVSSFLGLLHQLGGEVAALRFVGDNPAAPLGWLLPSQEDVFDVLSRGPRTVVDLLHSQGSVGAGRATMSLGPWGSRHELQVPAAERPLEPAELVAFPDLRDPDPAHQQRVREMAADMDLFSELAARSDVDYLAGRVAALDLSTHSLYPGLAGTAQELPPGSALAAIYRYLDHRVGELYRGLDADDVLIVMSDHGIRTTLEHDELAFFVAVGDQVPAGRLAGSPEIRGTARLVADLLGEPTQWPATGMESWVSALPPLGTAAP